MSKKSVLFDYNAMNIGGSTTSLLSILNRMDYDKYEVDLILNQNTGVLFDMIPSEVRVLEPARKYQNKPVEYLHRFCSPRYLWHYLKSKQIVKKTGVSIHGAQYREWKDIDFQREIEKEYDVAIAFLEGDRCKYVARHVKAKRKIAWIHVNYFDAKMDPKYDQDTMEKFDSIVLVSEDSKHAFDQCFPELSTCTRVIENILSTEYVKTMSKEPVDFKIESNRINLVTTCRITFESKALDRALGVIKRIKQEEHPFNLKWYIIGDGEDYSNLKDWINKFNLQNDIILLGSKINPYPYLKDMSMFFLPSRREGKPMAVTEAFMMGLPALVTEYSSAREQIRDGVDGIIVENSEQGIYDGLIRIIEHPEIITKLKKNVMNTDYSNVEEMKKVEQLIDGNN